jgi:hypothetical protein
MVLHVANYNHIINYANNFVNNLELGVHKHETTPTSKKFQYDAMK